MKLACFGYLIEPLEAAIEGGAQIERVFVEPARSRTAAMEAFCTQNHLPVTAITDWRQASGEVLGVLEKVDLGFSAAFGGIFSAPMIEAPRFGIANVHYSYLPEYRGNNPIEWMILNGENQGGVSIHWIAPEIDTGALIARERIELMPDDSYEDIFRRSSKKARDILEKLFRMPVEDWPRLPQEPASAAAYHPMRGLKDARIRSGDTWEHVTRLLRAESWKGIVHFNVEGRPCYALSGEGSQDKSNDTAPGVVEDAASGKVRIAFRNGTITLKLRDPSPEVQTGVCIDD